MCWGKLSTSMIYVWLSILILWASQYESLRTCTENQKETWTVDCPNSVFWVICTLSSSQSQNFVLLSMNSMITHHYASKRNDRPWPLTSDTPIECHCTSSQDGNHAKTLDPTLQALLGKTSNRVPAQPKHVKMGDTPQHILDTIDRPRFPCSLTSS